MRRWVVRFVWLLAAVAAAVLLYDTSVRIFWCGSTTLDVEFVVTDADSGFPISGAEIAVEGYDDMRPDEKEFTLTTDARGRARQACPNLFTFGQESRLGITSDTYRVETLKWEV